MKMQMANLKQFFMMDEDKILSKQRHADESKKAKQAE